MPRHIRRFSFLFTACFVFGLTSAIPGQDTTKRSDYQKDSPKVLAAFKDVVHKPSQSVVRITCDGKQTALGVVVGADGWVLTKYSEIKGKPKPMCRFKNGRELEAKVIGVHDKHDLALLKVEAKDLTPVEWAESKTEPVGNWVASAGLGELPVAVGVVSVATREIPKPRRIPISSGGYLGVGLDMEAMSAKITEVMPDTGAAKAGLKKDDVIVALNGKDLEGLEKFMETLTGLKPGDVVKLRVKRGEMELDFEATLGKRPANRGDFQNSLGSELSHRRSGFPAILQHDSVIKPSDCGGPLVDLDGKVIALNIARAGRTETYAVPSEVIQPLLPELMSGKLAPPKEPSPAEKLAEAKSVLEKAEKDKEAADKKVAELKAALQKAEKERQAAEKKAAEAMAAVEKAEQDAKSEK
jgi:serine protease Do